MRALLAEILYNDTVSPIALALTQDQFATGPEVEIPVYLDPRYGRRSLAVIEFSAGEFATAASDAFERVGHHDSSCLLHNNQGLYGSLGKSRTENRHSYDRHAAEFQDLPAGTERIQRKRIPIMFLNLFFFVQCYHGNWLPFSCFDLFVTANAILVYRYMDPGMRFIDPVFETLLFSVTQRAISCQGDVCNPYILLTVPGNYDII
jgi:hypothetical protein